MTIHELVQRKHGSYGPPSGRSSANKVPIGSTSELPEDLGELQDTQGVVEEVGAQPATSWNFDQSEMAMGAGLSREGLDPIANISPHLDNVTVDPDFENEEANITDQIEFKVFDDVEDPLMPSIIPSGEGIEIPGERAANLEIPGARKRARPGARKRASPGARKRDRLNAISSIRKPKAKAKPKGKAKAKARVTSGAKARITSGAKAKKSSALTKKRKKATAEVNKAKKTLKRALQRYHKIMKM